MDRRRALGIVLVVVSAAGFASGTILSQPIYDTGLDWLQLLAKPTIGEGVVVLFTAGLAEQRFTIALDCRT